MTKKRKTTKTIAKSTAPPTVDSLAARDSEGRFVDDRGRTWPMTPRHAFAAWCLMRGGIDSPMRLAELTGVTARVNWEALFMACDNMAWRLGSSITALTLARDKYVCCGCCGRVTHYVPCLTCPTADYVSATGRGSRSIWCDSRSHSYTATDRVINRHEAAYHGSRGVM